MSALLKNELVEFVKKTLPIISSAAWSLVKNRLASLVLLVFCYRRIEWPVQFGHTKLRAGN